MAMNILLTQNRVKPMLLSSLKKSELPTINALQYYVFQKFDGFRAVWDKGNFYGRNNENWLLYFPELIEALKEYKNCVFDGEIVDRTENPKPSNLQRRLTSNLFHIKMMSGIFSDKIPPQLPTTFMIFDVLEKDGVDLRNTPFENRQQILQDTLKENEWLRIVKPIEKSPQEAFKEVVEHNGEGIVLKKRGSPYIETKDDKRTDYWVKVKQRIEQIIKFDGYEVSNAGITLTDSKEGFRCACNGQKSHFVKQEIDTKGYAFVEVNGLEETENGRIRQIVFSRLVRVA